MSSASRSGLLARCLTLFAATVAIYVAVRLIESVAVALIVIVAVTGGLTLVVSIAHLLWRRHQMHRW